jgi:hypothetical protein
VKLEFGAVAERLEPENLKPLQFEQRELLRNSGQLSVASCHSVNTRAGCPMFRVLCETWGF